MEIGVGTQRVPERDREDQRSRVLRDVDGREVPRETGVKLDVQSRRNRPGRRHRQQQHCQPQSDGVADAGRPERSPGAAVFRLASMRGQIPEA